MFAALGRAAVRLCRPILFASLIFVAFSAVWGTGLFGALTGEGGFDDPASESVRARQQIERALGRDNVDVIVLYESATSTVDDPAYRQAVEQTLAALPADRLVRTRTYWSTGQPVFVSADRGSTWVGIQLAGANATERGAAFRAIEDDLTAPGLTTRVGGPTVVGRDINQQVTKDILRAEMISIPVLLVLLVLIFRSAVAALLPLLVGTLVIMGSFTLLRLITLGTDVSPFAINLVTMLGLGFAIDYALFVVSRFREELAGGAPVPAAVARTMATAGRTVVFSGLTVAFPLAGLTLFPQVFLRSMGFGGIAAVGLAVLGSVTVLPAALAVLGRHVDALRVPLPGRRRSGEPGARWDRAARMVMRRPYLATVAIVAVLLVLGLPFLRVEWGNADERVLPAGTGSRTVAETLAEQFPAGARPALTVAVVGTDGATPAGPSLVAYTQQLSSVSGVDGVQVAGAADGVVRIELRHGGDLQSARARELVEQVRAVPAPPGSTALVTGTPADLADLLASVGGRLPWMALLVVLTSLVLLFLAFGSLLIPVKSVLMNLLSLTASFGAIVLIFQDGNLSDALAFSPTGRVDVTMPVLMVAIAFGLSMDYEVFLLSRIREHWDRTHDPVEAVAAGVRSTAGIITSAAVLLVVVVGAFATSGVTFIKMIGVGLVIAILVDATVVRALLVPATMRILGRAAWWLPGPVARWWHRYGVRADGGEPAAPTADSDPERIRAHVA